jgi:hypothetical protein
VTRLWTRAVLRVGREQRSYTDPPGPQRAGLHVKSASANSCDRRAPAAFTISPRRAACDVGLLIDDQYSC